MCKEAQVFTVLNSSSCKEAMVFTVATTDKCTKDAYRVRLRVIHGAEF